MLELGGSCNIFFFNDTATTEIYTLSLHDALPIYRRSPGTPDDDGTLYDDRACLDRKSTRLNSSHLGISYAVFCLKKKKNNSPSFSIALALWSTFVLSATTHRL